MTQMTPQDCLINFQHNIQEIALFSNNLISCILNIYSPSSRKKFPTNKI